MKTTEKVLTMVVAFVGAVSGLWGAFTAHEAAKFKQPFDEHDQIVASFEKQIGSAEKRRDHKEILRVRIAFEKFEENWRRGREIAGLVAPVEALAVNMLDAQQLAELKLLFSEESMLSMAWLPAKTRGAAYFAVGDYANAAKYLKVASEENRDPKVLVLESAALGELANSAGEEKDKRAYRDMAVKSFEDALDSPMAKPYEFSQFAKKNASLGEILSQKGIVLEEKNL